MKTIQTDVGPLIIPDGCHSLINYQDDGRYNEHKLTDLVVQALSRNNDLFVDIGANIGYYTRYGSMRSKRAIAIEASLRNYMMLCSNASDLRNVTLFRAMAWNLDVQGELCMDELNCADNRPFGDDRRKELVQKMRLDTILSNYEQVHGEIGNMVVKIDTQGSDHIVLEGFGDYIDRIDECFVELWPYGMKETDGSTIESVTALYRQWGFGVSCVEMPLEDVKDDAYVNLRLRRDTA